MSRPASTDPISKQRTVTDKLIIRCGKEVLQQNTPNTPRGNYTNFSQAQTNTGHTDNQENTWPHPTPNKTHIVRTDFRRNEMGMASLVEVARKVMVEGGNLAGIRCWLIR